ncbi:MAG: class I SAM-dependent rRNA methyltransferase [Bacteroidetes bacterium]|jgi:23S rRNA (cytosine1962-C5)-methyltransferase|nr:class I SAM-dependent rRNA methyltransferase [Bacteroidota bacterium]MBP7256408.1 class I SAM-dependent rRNA methyltransferase [Chitinophagales bacterium]MBK7505918.1 class I SAM-dependent rRNA methyltransferase [Bacteroidota bacterium]MBK7639235.1 class I SAM-dependent rRNA methyltransferase [Bacteroidota bacterium]MBK8673016.1 class I SAM-dependent rRNA methyltransferase [Bacteroidota bacterium]
MEKKIFLKPGREESVLRFHPWVFSGAVRNGEGEFTDGDWVNVYDSRQQFLAAGFVNDGSIVVKIYTYNPELPDFSFWNKKVKSAFDLRQVLGFLNNDKTNCYRLIHGEGDGFPGLIVDVYAGVAVFQAHSIGVFLHREMIAKAIVENSNGTINTVFNKSSKTLPKEFAQNNEDGFIIGTLAEQTVLENGHKFIIDWKTGQKTGFFLDQRENRALVANYVNGKSVLNTFSYTGGFSIYALKNGAKNVDSVDVSKPALDILDRNIEINGLNIQNHQSKNEDTLDFLKSCNPYDIVILDPPAYAKSIAKRHNAVQGYKRLNIMGLEKVKRGGFLFTFSCSQVIDKQLFYQTVMSAAIESKRNIKVLHHLSQGADHPVNIFHPEGSYLKGLTLFVE